MPWLQAPKVPGQSVRLHGSCLKVWDAAALMAQRPILTVHDVLKHMQLEDGRLFLWRIAGDAVIPVVRRPPPAQRRECQPNPETLLRLHGTQWCCQAHLVAFVVLRPAHIMSHLTPSHLPLHKQECLDGEDLEEVAEAAHWAEHPAITASVLAPGPLALQDVPLEASYGRWGGRCGHGVCVCLS